MNEHPKMPRTISPCVCARAFVSSLLIFMAALKPFAALRPAPELASQICELPYDVMSSDEAREIAAGNPLSFLHVSKPEIDLPRATAVDAPEVYAKGKENFQKLISRSALKQDDKPCFYLYRQIMGKHSQTGLVAAASCEEYLRGIIKKHELTRPDKEDDRVRHIETLNSQTGPVFLTYRASTTLDDLFKRKSAETPDIFRDTGNQRGKCGEARYLQRKERGVEVRGVVGVRQAGVAAFPELLDVRHVQDLADVFLFRKSHVTANFLVGQIRAKIGKDAADGLNRSAAAKINGRAGPIEDKSLKFLGADCQRRNVGVEKVHAATLLSRKVVSAMPKDMVMPMPLVTVMI